MALNKTNENENQKEDASKDDVGQKNRKVPYHFGEKLRQVREHNGYTLKYVAQKAGVSESLVSQIERNHVSPAIDTLLALADVLDINLEFLFEEYKKERPVKIVRSTERLNVKEDDTLYQELAGLAGTNQEASLETYIITIPVGSHSHRGFYGHIGREIGIITNGKGILKYGEKEYTLEAGDSVSFSSEAPHVMVNAGDVPLEAIWVVSPAQRFKK